MAVQMSEKQFRQQFSPEQRKALERLLQRQVDENKREVESEASTDTPKSTLSGSSGPPAVPPRTPPAPPANPPSGESHGGGHPPKVVPVRVVENHPSVAAQPVKIVSDSTTAAIVSSVHHLEEETKFGFYRLVMAFSQLYDSLKNLGTGQRGPTAAPAQGSPARQHQRTYDPARPDSGPIKPYTRQADKFETYGNKVFHERVQEALTPEAIGDRLKNAMFDREGFVGGYAHRMFDRRKVGREYAARKLRESSAHKDSIDEDAKKLAKEGKSKSEVDAYREARLKIATDQGLITDLSEKELRQRGMEINDLRQKAVRKVGVLEHRRNRGERTEAINRSKEARELEAINEKIGEKDSREAYLLDRYRKRKSGGTTSATPEPTPAPAAPVEPEIGSAERPYVWPSSRTEPTPAPTGTPLEAQRSGDTAQSTKESQEEAAHFNAEFLKGVERIEENTRPIPEISKFLNEKFGTKEGIDTESGAEPSSILPSITDLIPPIPGGGTTSKLMTAAKFVGRNAKGLSAVGAGLFGAYDAYTGMQAADQKVAEGQITAEQATVDKGRAVGSGVGMAFGAGFGGAIGSVLGPLGTVGGAYLGSKIGGAIGDVGGEIATTGAQSLYHGYQWLTGQESDVATPKKGKQGGGWSKVVGDLRETPRDEFWTDGKYNKDFMGPLPGEQLKSMSNLSDGTPVESWGKIDRTDAESFKRQPAVPPTQTNNTGIVVNAPSTSTTQVMPPITKPSFNTDPTFLKYGSSRWGI